MKSNKSDFTYLLAAVIAATMAHLVACNSSGDTQGGSGSGVPLLPASGVGGGAAGTMVTDQSGGIGPVGTGGSVGTGGANVAASGGGGAGGSVDIGGTGAVGGPPDVFDSGAGDGEAGTTADTGGPLPVDTGTEDTAPPLPPGTLPTPSDYGAPGPFSDAIQVDFVGPNNNYTMFRPGASLGKDGFKHPIVSWGNGITTTPAFYTQTLTLIATHGFVIIGTNDTTVEEPAVSAGLDWLAAQNDVPGDLQGKLDTSREATVGYSWGGGASIDTAYRPNVRCTISIHGMPPRNGTAFSRMHAPLMLTTSTGDTFVSAAQFVTPNYQKSTVQTFYLTLDNALASHFWVVDILGGMLEERAPVITWLRAWLYEEQDAKSKFGDPGPYCSAPFSCQRKNWP